MLPRLEKPKVLQTLEAFELNEDLTAEQKEQYADQYYDLTIQYLKDFEKYITTNWEDLDAKEALVALQKDAKELLENLDKALRLAPTDAYAEETKEAIEIAKSKIQTEFPFLLAIKKGDAAQIKKLANENPSLLNIIFDQDRGDYNGYSLAAFLLFEGDVEALRLVLNNITEDAKKSFCSTTITDGPNTGLSPLMLASSNPQGTELVTIILPFSDVNFVAEEGEYEDRDSLYCASSSPCNIETTTVLLNDPRLELTQKRADALAASLREQIKKSKDKIQLKTQLQSLLQLLLKKNAPKEQKQSAPPAAAEKVRTPVVDEIPAAITAPAVVVTPAAAQPLAAVSAAAVVRPTEADLAPASTANADSSESSIKKRKKEFTLKPTNARTTTVAKIKFYLEEIKNHFKNHEGKTAQLISQTIAAVEKHQTLDHEDCKALLTILKKELISVRSKLETKIKSLERAKDVLVSRNNSMEDEAFTPLVEIEKTRALAFDELTTHIQFYNSIVQQITHGINICIKEWLVVPDQAFENPQQQGMQIDPAGGSSSGGAAAAVIAEVKAAESSNAKPMDSVLGKRSRSSNKASVNVSVAKHSVFAAQAAVAAAAQPAPDSSKDHSMRVIEPI